MKAKFRLARLVLLAVTILGAIGWTARGVPAPAQTVAQTAAAQTAVDRNSPLDVGLLKPEERNAARDAISSQPIAKLRAAGDESRRRWLALSSRDAWERELRTPALAALRKSLGDFPATTSGKVVVHETGVIRGDGFEIAKIVFESEPQVWVAANLYRPSTPSGDAGTDSKADDASKKKSRPGIIICHAHHTPKEHGELQDMGMTWARLGCVVLVPDAIGHGERRQHPFRSASDYPREFRVSRQDYNFRYDVGVQLHLAGRSLIGQIAWDLRRGVDVLLAQPGVDPTRIALLGSVAGGGDPAAVAAAVDDRIAVVAPFNFGGPQPETRFPLPDDVETSFLYTGSGGWESTRNLRSSAAGGFLPWVIVGGIAPRRLIYSHEFSWDRERDPVWKRLEKVYSWYDLRDRLSFTHGRGELKGRPPEASHCTHIGPLHRRLIHETLAQAFGLPADAASREYSKNLSTEELRCWTPELTAKLAPRPLRDVLRAKLDEAGEQSRKTALATTSESRREAARRTWNELLGRSAPTAPARVVRQEPASNSAVAGLVLRRTLLEVEPGIQVPVIELTADSANEKRPVVVAVSQGGSTHFAKQRGGEIRLLCEKGFAVCLVDVRGTGETSLGDDRGRGGRATSVSSSHLMLDETLLGLRLHDLRSVLAWLGARADVDGRRVVVWGDSPSAPLDTPAMPIVPHLVDGRPREAEPLGQILALLAALYEPNVRGVFARGGITSIGDVLARPAVGVPHDLVVPGVLTRTDLPDLVAALSPLPIRLEAMVDAGNCKATSSQLDSVYGVSRSAYRKDNAESKLAVSASRNDSVAEALSDWVAK